MHSKRLDGSKCSHCLQACRVESAFRTLPDRIGKILQKRSAFRATGDGARSRHVDAAAVRRCFLFWRQRIFRILFSSAAGPGILVSALPIFAIGQKCLLETPHSAGYWRGSVHKSFFLHILFSARLQSARVRRKVIYAKL